MTTISEIYAALNPLPAMLSAKGKVKPEVTFMLHANAHITIHMSWKKAYSRHDWETDCECFTADTFKESLGQAKSFINELPSAEQAKLHQFMAKLGHVIDAARDDGIDLDYLNPLLDTMKRLSENVITYRLGTA